MTRERVGRLPVVSRKDPGHGVGMLTRSDLIHAQSRRLDAEHRGEPTLRLGCRKNGYSRRFRTCRRGTRRRALRRRESFARTTRPAARRSSCTRLRATSRRRSPACPDRPGVGRPSRPSRRSSSRPGRRFRRARSSRPRERPAPGTSSRVASRPICLMRYAPVHESRRLEPRGWPRSPGGGPERTVRPPGYDQLDAARGGRRGTRRLWILSAMAVTPPVSPGPMAGAVAGPQAQTLPPPAHGGPPPKRPRPSRNRATCLRWASSSVSVAFFTASMNATRSCAVSRS
jgi:hypothetical protein